MPDFEMPYFVDGGGNKGYFKDSTARDQVSDINSDLTIKDISSQATIDTDKVMEFNAYVYGKLIYIHLRLKPGVTDQARVVTGLPFIKGYYGVLPMFHMNAADATSNGVCAYSDNFIQYRGSTTTGTAGTQYSGMFLLA